MVGAPALTRSTAIESYAAQSAMQDGTAHVAHEHVNQSPPSGTWGENEITWWPVVMYQSTREVIQSGLARMWDEGSGGGHYRNMVATLFTQMGCGVYIANGEITVTQDFQ
jgi:hypothetical protein